MLNNFNKWSKNFIFLIYNYFKNNLFEIVWFFLVFFFILRVTYLVNIRIFYFKFWLFIFFLIWLFDLKDSKNLEEKK